MALFRRIVLALALVAWITRLGAAQEARSGPALGSRIAAGHAQRWDTLAIGERVGRFGRSMEGIPYVAGTLEGPGPEACRVTTEGLDCVTFMELALNLARTTRAADEREPAPEDVIDAVTFTRYRAGRLDGYLSRLHYTSEWIADNIAKGVLEDVTPSLGGVRFPLSVGYMSSHPEAYPALRANPALADSMRHIERRINATRRTHIPRDRVAAIERRLQTGDLVAISTSIQGLDYSHTGLIVRDGNGARLLHASSKAGRVLLDDRIGAYMIQAPRSSLGITVLRPTGATASRPTSR